MQRVHLFSAGAVVVTTIVVMGVTMAWKAWSPLAQAGAPTPISEPSPAVVSSPSPEPTLGFSLEQFLDQKSTLLPTDASLEGFFQEAPTSTSPPQNLTEIYKGQAGQPGGQTLVDFVKAQPIVTTLPMVKLEAVLVDQALATPTGQQEYLAAIKASPALAGGSQVRVALEQLITNNLAGVQAQITIWQQAAAALRAQHVPPQAQQLHRLLIGYTESMVATLQMAARWHEDQVAALVAIRQLDALDRRYAPVIEQGVQNL